MKKYLCVRDNKIEAEWLPRWYGVPFEECVFVTDAGWQHVVPNKGLLVLTPLPKNSNYKEHLKILKTERLFQL